MSMFNYPSTFEIQLRDNEPFWNGESGQGHRWCRYQSDPIRDAQPCWARWTDDHVDSSEEQYLDNEEIQRMVQKGIVIEVWMVVYESDEFAVGPTIFEQYLGLYTGIVR